MPPRAASQTARPCGSSTSAANTAAAPRSRAAPGPGVVHGLGIWWRKLGLDGTNVNQLTSQRLTDIGRGPTFYDCLVQVERAAETAAAP